MAVLQEAKKPGTKVKTPKSIGELNAVVYNIETYPEDESITELQIENQLLAVAVTFDEQNGLKEWYEEEVGQLVYFLKTFEYIVGYNQKRFDNRVLNEYVPGLLGRFK